MPPLRDSARSGLCPDWICAKRSNVHVAVDREWFVDYRPIHSTLAEPQGLNVRGIGTVEIPVRRFPDSAGPESHGKLCLENVLHVPGMVCNIIGYPGFESFGVNMSFGRDQRGSAGEINDRETGQRLANLVHKKFIVLDLSPPPHGPVVGPSRSEPDTAYLISVFWPDSEREKWKDANTLAQPAATTEPEGFTTQEKDWLKKNYGNEFKFLQMNGLSVYRDDDREEGRRIVRALMTRD